MSNEKLAIKRLNRNRIYKYILERDHVSIADIARDLLISLPTATQHIQALLKDGLLIEKGLCESTGGRRPKAYACNPVARVGCGINITHSSVDIVIVDLLGNLVDHNVLSVNGIVNRETMWNIREILLDMLRRKAFPESAVIGVGISLPAIIDASNTIHETAFDAPLPGNFQENLQEALPFQLNYINDASSGGYAEFWHCKEENNIFFLSLSNSVGGAVRIHGQVYDGDDFRSAEIGHVTIVPNGRRCHCGQRGCANTYCSSNNLRQAADGSLSQFFQNLEAKDPHSVEVWDSYTDYLVNTINNIRLLYDCDVIIGGSVGRYIPKYIPELKRRLAGRDSFNRAPNFIKVSKYDSESSAVGAALKFIDKFISEV